MRSFFRQLRIEYNHIIFYSSVMIVLALAPVFYSVFYAFPYVDEVPRKVDTAVVNLDGASLSRQLVQMLDGAENIDVTHRPVTVNEAKELLFDRKVYSVVIIPADFSANLMKGIQADVAVYSDGSYLMYYKQTYNAVQTVAMTLGAGVSIQRLQSKGVPYYAVSEKRTSLVLESYGLFNPAGGYATYVMPAVFVLICHQLMLIGICMIMAHERHGGGRFIIPPEPVSPILRLSAKTVAYFTVIMLQSMILGMVLSIFKIPFVGSWADLLLFALPFYLCVVFLGIFLGSFMHSPERALMYLVVSSIPLLFMSGFSWRPEAMAGWVQVLREFLPSTHGISAFIRIFREGATLSDVAYHIRALWGLAAVFCALAYMRLRKQTA